MPKVFTNEYASTNILKAVREGRLIQSSWHCKGEAGKELACLLGSIDKSVASSKHCNGKLMPMWMAEVTPVLFDGLPKEEINNIGKRYGVLIGKWDVLVENNWNNIQIKFLIKTIDDALDAARPVNVGKAYWKQIEDACNQCKAAIKSGNKDAANADAAYAARAAAAAAANAANADATAAYFKLFDFLLNCIEQEINSL